MIKKKIIEFMGVELTRGQIESYKAWLQMEEGKIHRQVVESLLHAAERNALKDPQQGSDWALFTAQREQYIGEAKGLRKIKLMPEALDEA